MYVCICMYVCMYVCIYLCNVYMYVCICMYVCMYVYVCVCVYMCICMYVCMCMCVCVRACVCVCTCLLFLCTVPVLEKNACLSGIECLLFSDAHSWNYIVGWSSLFSDCPNFKNYICSIYMEYIQFAATSDLCHCDYSTALCFVCNYVIDISLVSIYVYDTFYVYGSEV